MMTLDTFIPLPEAARRFGLAEASLRALVDKGTIKAGKLPTGEIVVSEQDTQAQKPTLKEELPEYKKHAHLKGQAIWLSEAERKYGISTKTLFRWANTGIIRVLGKDGNKVLRLFGILRGAAIYGGYHAKSQRAMIYQLTAF